MSSSIIHLASRQGIPAALAVLGGASCFSPTHRGMASSCEDSTAVKGAVNKIDVNNPFMRPNLPETTLRKRMTSVGRFSLTSQTEANPSVPVFFLALSSGSQANKRKQLDERGTRGGGFRVDDFEDAWMKNGMPSRHPRFHSVVCEESKYFEEKHNVKPGVEDDDETYLEIKAELDRHVFETLHYSVYRDDLRSRIEDMLMSPLQVKDKLWEVYISNGLLGSSGGISKAKVDLIVQEDMEHPSNFSGSNRGSILFRRTTKKGPWEDAASQNDAIPLESILLFRSHHALADGASIMAALSDLCDEAEEIREQIRLQLLKWKRRRDSKKGFRKILSKILRLIKLCLWFIFGTARALAYQSYLQLTTRVNPFDAVKFDAETKGLAASGRSLSWCDAAPLDEAKTICKVLSKAKGSTITINDLFVSCITAAVTRQLVEHEEFMAPVGAHKTKCVGKHMNVVVPVHMRGGVVLPGESVGNNIGAFVCRCPAEMKHDAKGGSCSVERLEKVHESLLYMKKSPAPIVSHALAKFCSNFLPSCVTKSIFESANANASVVITNTRGRESKIHINGMPVESVAGFIPLPPGVPVGVVVQSYAGSMSLSLTAERYAIPDPDKFLQWVVEEYQALRHAAANLQ
mmetsp:Transcript_27793/g.62309  ORF Transcript_27793/g.62309 Transcript_27793/m.62309 type:complete len:631 (-) Transcript_27793:61-1953(-)